VIFITFSELNFHETYIKIFYILSNITKRHHFVTNLFKCLILFK